MSGEQRELVLYKRKLRNRESARRSRQKRQATVTELQEEIDDLMHCSSRMIDISLALREENDSLQNKLAATTAELKTLRGFCPKSGAPPGGGGPAPLDSLKRKLGG